MSSDTTKGGGSDPTGEDERSPATPESTREALVRATGGGYLPVRRVFVQKHDGANRGSTLGRLVRQRKRRELILYLLVLTRWSAEDRAAWPADVWLRALEVNVQPQLTWSRSSLSEAWTELVRLKLVNRRRERRLSKITPRREDRKTGYERPDGKAQADQYFTLPGEFWTERWFDRLSLAGIAVLLILLKETNKNDEVQLTHAETALWYGISESTAKKGYGELDGAGLVNVRSEYRMGNFSATGLVEERFYSLTGPFSTDARRASRAVAAKEMTARRRRAKKSKPAPAGAA